VPEWGEIVLGAIGGVVVRSYCESQEILNLRAQLVNVEKDRDRYQRESAMHHGNYNNLMWTNQQLAARVAELEKRLGPSTT
jgi:hypothetical protein